MAAKSQTPVINASDGWNEHPTQALIDIYAMRRGLGTIRGRSIAFGGDPRGRVVRSLIQLLRFEAPKEIVFCPTLHYEVPADILSTKPNSLSYHSGHPIRADRLRCDYDGSVRHVRDRRAGRVELRLAP
jgi:aspartate carbamoyltransferase catalytic subunit